MAATKKTAKKKTATRSAAKTAPKVVKKAAAPKAKAAPKKTAARKPAAKTASKKAKAPIQAAKKTTEKTMTKANKQFDQFTNEATEAGRESMDAMMKCGNIWMKGCEDMIQATTAIMQDAAQKQNQYIKEAMSAKTLNEFAETQNKIAQASYDDFMQGATKITELGVKVLTEATEPFNAQMAKTMQKAGQTVCA